MQMAMKIRLLMIFCHLQYFCQVVVNLFQKKKVKN